MRVRILGPFHLEDGGRPITIGASAYLAGTGLTAWA